jgi:superfamily II DNA or RNA helicase
MRPPAIEKMGYYPTDEPLVEIIQTYLKPPIDSGRLFDPCAGEGRAASILGKALNCETWGVELSPDRAEKAQNLMDKIYQAPWQACTLSDESVSWLYLNPPYDFDRFEGHPTQSSGTNKRLEWDFLKTTTSKLMRGGLLTYIVPQKTLGMIEVARLLAGHFEAITVYRFPDGLYEKYKQVVVLAYKRKHYQPPTDKEVFSLQSLATTELEPIRPAIEPIYELQPAPTRAANGKTIVFKRTDWEPEEVVEATIEAGFHRTSEWLDLIHPKRGLAQLSQPVMPLKKGHIAMLMASGMMGTVRLTDDEGKPMLIKGRVIKVVEKTEQPDTKDVDSVVETYKDRFVTTVAVLMQNGIQIIQDVKGLSEFMKVHGEKIAAHVLETYKPIYNLDPTQKEITTLDTLGTLRKALPGQDRAGLLPAQRHAAAALARSIRKNNVANCQAEMGTGKTTISTGVIELLDAYPAIVLCPPHLVPKWIREIEEVIPGAHAREIRRIGRNSDEFNDVNDVRNFLDQYQKANKIAERETGSKLKWVAVVAHTSAKFGARWQPAVITRKTRDPLTGKLVNACACPGCGKVVMTEKDGFIIPVTDATALADKRQFCHNSIPGWELEADGKTKQDIHGDPVWGSRPCGTPLFEFNGARRHSISEYIAKHAKGDFKLLIADEVHQFKSKSSDRGVAFHQLVTAAKWTLTLTGTFFGGKSTSIFWLLHRLNHGVRKDFAFHDEKRWARLYGVLETTRRRRRDDDADEDGVFTGNRRYRNQAKEQPGVSPAIVSRLLDTTIFLSLKDLNLAMPAYKEEVVTLDMLDDQGQQYHSMNTSLKQLAVQSGRYLSTWLQWSLARPNSAFRDEVVFVDEVNSEDGKTVRKVPLMELPAIPTGHSSSNPNGQKWLPKESWLADFCKTEKQQGRKVLVYVRQTGTRDIQDRVMMPLQANGMRVSILSGNVAPRKREEWIAKRVQTTDVLICNPRLVETGLDLVQFSTVVFFEIEYSLYTLWQSVRRVWRLGQTQPVKAIFSVYSSAMEATALALMGKKMKAAQLVYGDEVGGAIVPEEEGDFLTQLARDVLDGAKLSDLQTLFADDLQVSHNPLGSLTTPSAVILPGTKIMTWDDWVSQKTVVVRRTRKKEVVPEGQMGLWI